MRLGFRLPAGSKSAPVTYTPKSGTLALGDLPAAGRQQLLSLPPHPCPAPVFSRGEGVHAVPKGPSSPYS